MLRVRLQWHRTLEDAEATRLQSGRQEVADDGVGFYDRALQRGSTPHAILRTMDGGSALPEREVDDACSTRS